MTAQEITRFRGRIGDRIKSTSDVVLGDGNDTTFNLRFSNVFNLTVYINGSQENSSNYNLSSSAGAVTFDSAPADGASIQFDYSYAAFTDTEIEDLVDSYGFDNAVVEALRELLADSARLYDYAQGATDSKLSQVFSHLKELLKVYTEEATGFQSAAGTTYGQVHVGKRIHDNYKKPPEIEEDFTRID